jgi:hypothetical protein
MSTVPEGQPSTAPVRISVTGMWKARTWAGAAREARARLNGKPEVARCYFDRS